MHINIGVATLVSILVANTTQHGNKASISIKKIGMTMSQGWIHLGGWSSPPTPPAPIDEMTITKCRPTKVGCSHRPGTLLPEAQDEALDIGHCCNPKNNVNSVLDVLLMHFPKMRSVSASSSELDESLDALEDCCWRMNLHQEGRQAGASPPKHCHRSSERQEPCAFCPCRYHCLESACGPQRQPLPAQKVHWQQGIHLQQGCPVFQSGACQCCPKTSSVSVLLQCCSVPKLHALHQHWTDMTIQQRHQTTGNQNRINNTLSLITATFHRSKPKWAQHFHFVQATRRKKQYMRKRPTSKLTMSRVTM